MKTSSARSSSSRPSACAREARSPQVRVGVGEPTTWKPPASASSTTSSTFASSCSAASCRASSATTSAACWAATPPIWVDFEPNVPTPCCTSSVSPLTTRTASTGRPSLSATIIANVVSCPWPCEKEPVRRMASPSGVISTAPNSGSTRPFVISTYTLTPMPERDRVAVLAASSLFLPQRVVARRLECEVECTLVVAGVVVRA